MSRHTFSLGFETKSGHFVLFFGKEKARRGSSGEELDSGYIVSLRFAVLRDYVAHSSAKAGLTAVFIRRKHGPAAFGAAGAAALPSYFVISLLILLADSAQGAGENVFAFPGNVFFPAAPAEEHDIPFLHRAGIDDVDLGEMPVDGQNLEKVQDRTAAD